MDSFKYAQLTGKGHTPSNAIKKYAAMHLTNAVSAHTLFKKKKKKIVLICSPGTPGGGWGRIPYVLIPFPRFFFFDISFDYGQK